MSGGATTVTNTITPRAQMHSTSDNTTTCQAFSVSTGAPCRAKTWRGTKFCYAHHPDLPRCKWERGCKRTDVKADGMCDCHSKTSAKKPSSDKAAAKHDPDAEEPDAEEVGERIALQNGCDKL